MNISDKVSPQVNVVDYLNNPGKTIQNRFPD